MLHSGVIICVTVLILKFDDFDEFRYELPVCELKKSLEERLSEGGGQVELLAAVVNLSTFCLQWNIIGAANWQANMPSKYGWIAPANRAESVQ